MTMKVLQSQSESGGHFAIAEFARLQTPAQGAICDTLQAQIDKALPNATCRIWHGGPVWFIGENPVVGYNVRSGRVNLMFWSGQLFDEPLLRPAGKDKAAVISLQDGVATDAVALRRWLRKARSIQFDYVGTYARKRAAARGTRSAIG